MESAAPHTRGDDRGDAMQVDARVQQTAQAAPLTPPHSPPPCHSGAARRAEALPKEKAAAVSSSSSLAGRQALLDANVSLLHTLVGLAKLQGGQPATAAQHRLMATLRQNLALAWSGAPPRRMRQLAATRTHALSSRSQPGGGGSGGGGGGGLSSTGPLPAAVRAVHYARSLGLLRTPAEPTSTPLQALTSGLPAVVVSKELRRQPHAANSDPLAPSSATTAAATPALTGATDERGGASLYATAEEGLDAQEREDLKRIHWVNKTTAPKGWTGGKWHKLERIDGVSFYEGVDIVDADDPERIYSFRLSDPPHAACFRMSDSDHGNNIRISYSNCLSFYELPDGTKWAEHGYFYDKDDLTDHVQHENRRLPVARQVDIATLLHADHGERELVRLDGHFHSMLTEVEDECWVYSHQLYTKLQSSGELSHPEDSFYFRTTIDTTNFRVLQGGPPGSAAAGRQAEANPDEPPKRRGRPPKRKAEE